VQVTVQMLDNALGRIDLEGTISFYLRGQALAARWWLHPSTGSAVRHMTWSIVATGESSVAILVLSSAAAGSMGITSSTPSPCLPASRFSQFRQASRHWFGK